MILDSRRKNMKLIHDTQLIFGRSLKVSLRNPFWLALGLFQPILYLLLFAPLLDGLAGAPGFTGGNALNVFSPGLLILMAMFGSSFVGFGVIEDLRSGVFERLRVTPASRLALLLGMVLRDIVVLMVQSALLVGVATLMGLRADPAGLVLLFALLGLIGVTLSSVSYSIALAVKDEGSLAATVNTFMLPLMLLSGIMLPLALAPQIIRTIAGLNPFAHAVDAARALVNGDMGSAAILSGFGLVAVLAVVAVIWAVRSFRQATA
jgi:ABC-2 type transport system permease protein